MASARLTALRAASRASTKPDSYGRPEFPHRHRRLHRDPGRFWSGRVAHSDGAASMTISLSPISKAQADVYIRDVHRHHRPTVGALWWQGAKHESGELAGVAVVGRPVARALDDGLTVEVTRLCTDGSKNVCSLLYSATRRVALAKGYRRGLTYIRASETGASLRAAGWQKLWAVRGRSWDCPSRPRVDKHPTEDKVAYGWGDWGVGQ